MIKHIWEHLDCVVSILLGGLLIVSINYFPFPAILVGVIACIAILISVLEIFKQFFNKESTFWKASSLIACVYSILFSMVIIRYLGFIGIPLLPALSNGILFVLSCIEIGQGLFWIVVNVFEK